MIALVHVLAGAVVGVIFSRLDAVVVVAFLSHYVLDVLPHIDAETFAVPRLPYSWLQRTSVVVDALAAGAICIILFLTHERWLTMTVGGLVAMLPDLLMPLERHPWLRPLHEVHELLHWDPIYARRWSWYIAGISTPVVIGTLALVAIWGTY